MLYKNQSINVLALVKGNERYVFLYDDESRAETLRTLGRFASHPELSFTWYDAACLSQRVRQEKREAEKAKEKGLKGLTGLTGLVNSRFLL